MLGFLITVKVVLTIVVVVKVCQAPISQAVLKPSIQKDGCSFNVRWYKDFRWIHYCSNRKKVFFNENGLLTFTAHPKTAFFIEGFNNWKKVVEHFHVDEKAECHKEAKNENIKFQDSYS